MIYSRQLLKWCSNNKIWSTISLDIKQKAVSQEPLIKQWSNLFKRRNPPRIRSILVIKSHSCQRRNKLTCRSCYHQDMINYLQLAILIYIWHWAKCSHLVLRQQFRTTRRRTTKVTKHFKCNNILIQLIKIIVRCRVQLKLIWLRCMSNRFRC